MRRVWQVIHRTGMTDFVNVGIMAKQGEIIMLKKLLEKLYVVYRNKNVPPGMIFCVSESLTG